MSLFNCAHLCPKHSFPISNFLEAISGLHHSNVFLYFFALITRKAFLKPLLAILWNSAFRCVCLSFLLCLLLLFFSKLFVRPSQTTFLHFFFLRMVLIWYIWTKNTKIMASHSITSWKMHGETMKTVTGLLSWAPKSLEIVTAAVKKRDADPWKIKLWKT